MPAVAERRQRIDRLLVDRGLVESRTRAQALLIAGAVVVDGQRVDKAGALVALDADVRVRGHDHPYVSRGGVKLQGALEHFSAAASSPSLVIEGRVAMDIGASTGGFTDCLLQRGAAHVVALDVGHGQLHPRIRSDERVTVIERFHVRDVTRDAIGGTVDLVTADLSFISLTRVLGALVGVCAPGAHLVALVKPQFEAGRVEVSRGHGVITDPAIHDRVRGEVHASLEAAGCAVLGWVDSPITGGDGNREFLVHATVQRPGFPA